MTVITPDSKNYAKAIQVRLAVVSSLSFKVIIKGKCDIRKDPLLSLSLSLTKTELSTAYR